MPLSFEIILFTSSQVKSGSGIIFFASLSLFIFFSSFPFAKTIAKFKDPSENLNIKIKANNPANISTSYDGNGAYYLVWSESTSPIESKVLFTHVNPNIKTLNEPLGKTISELSFIQKDPKLIEYAAGDAIIAWKDYSIHFGGDIFLQRISGEKLLWGEGGIRVTTSPKKILDYAFTSDAAGNIFVAYLTRNEYPSNDHNLLYQRVLSDGSLAFKSEPILIEQSSRKKSKIKVIHDQNGGAYFLWTEVINNKEVLLLKKVDPSGKSVLGKRPIKISGSLNNVAEYSLSIIGNFLLYIAWETDDKNIYHQLINSKGKAIWTIGGIKAAFTKGKNFMPQVLQQDSLITLSWINVLDNINNLMVQRFKTSGKQLWNEHGAQALSSRGRIARYVINNFIEGGIFTSWLVQNNSLNAWNLGAQSISAKGVLLWDSIRTNSNALINGEKHFYAYAISQNNADLFYTSLNDEIVFERIERVTIPENDFLTLSTESFGNSIRLKINSNIINDKALIIFERLVHSDTTANKWKFIGTIDSISSLSEHEFVDTPNEFGTLYYRCIIKNKSKELVSNISRIDFLEAASKIIVAQNNPNPFRDSTTISFYLPTAASVSFEFFDDHIEKIGELEEKSYPAGENSVTFFGKGLRPGIYFYKLLIKDFVEVKKMVVN